MVNLPDENLSQVFLLTDNAEKISNKYVIIKLFQLILSGCSLVVFVTGASTNSSVENMLISAFLGALAFHPLQFIISSIKIKHHSSPTIYTIVVNIICFIGLIGLSVITVRINKDSSIVENTKPSPSESFAYITLKMSLIIASILNSLLYVIESGLIYQEDR